MNSEMSKSIKTQKFRIKKVTHEGTVWGYLVVVGLAIPIGLCVGGFTSFGLLFNDFLTSIGAGSSALTTVIGSFAFCASISSLFASSLIQRFALRSVGVFGAIVFSLGGFMSIFVPSVEHLIISYGILQGAGFGLIGSVGYTVFNHYFVKRRIFMMSVTQMLIGTISSIYPIAVQFFLETYGLRGTTAIIAAIHAHTILAMLVMNPNYNYKLIRIPIEETLISSNENKTEVKIMVPSEDENKMELPSADTKSISVVPDLLQNGKPDDSVMQLIRNEGNDSESDAISSEGFDTISTRISSILSLNNLKDAVVLNEMRSKNGKWQKVVNFLDLTLLKDPIYLNIVIGITFSMFSDNTFSTLLPMYLFELGFTKSEAATVVATGPTAGLMSRIFLAVVSYYIQFKARHIFLAGALITIFIRIAFMNVSNFYGTTVIIATINFFQTWCYATKVLVVAEYLPRERFASGYGLLMFTNGNLMFILSPIFGWVRDVTQSYVICFNTLTTLMCICVIPWIAEMCWFRFHLRKNSN